MGKVRIMKILAIMAITVFMFIFAVVCWLIKMAAIVGIIVGGCYATLWVIHNYITQIPFMM